MVPLAAKTEVPPPAREGPELIAATRPFAHESLGRSVFHSASTIAVLLALAAVGASPLHWGIRLVSAVVMGLTVVRGFILYHDVMHSAMFRGPTLLARLGRLFFKGYGLWVLTPPVIWKESHNYHHAHTAKLVGSSIGSYPIVTTGMWRRMNKRQRFAYNAVRHPLTILFGYVTIFLFGMVIAPGVRNPRKYWDCWLALALHIALGYGWYVIGGAEAVVFAHVLPLAVSMAAGSYLFYAQHNFPGMRLASRETWSYTRAALESSSYLETGPLMAWFTGNIGFHHVHHLNPSIPFYRLPDAMQGVDELRHPLGVTSLRPADIIRCFRLKVWDPVKAEMRTDTPN